MLDKWLATILQVLKVGLGNPRNELELVVYSAVAALIAVFVMSKIGQALGTPMPEISRCIGVFLITVLAVLLIVAAVRLHLVPRIASPVVRHWAPLGAAILAALVFGVAALCLLQRTNVLKALVTLLISAAAAAAAVALVDGAFGLATHEKANFNRARERTDGMNEFLSK